MKKIIFTGILSLSMILGACGADYDEMVQEVEEANEQAGIGATSEEEQANEVEEKEKQDKAAAEKEQAEKEKAEAERAAKEQQEKEEKLAAEKAAEEKAAAEKAAAEKVAKEEIDLEQVHLAIMQEHMNMYVDITFDKDSKTFKMTPTNEQLITEIEMLPLGIGWDNWQDMVDGVVSMSKANSDSLGEGYSITLINPLNKENIILWVMDGEVIYNVVDEL